MNGAPFYRSEPLRAGALLSAALALYRREVRGAWTIAGLISIPAQVLVWIMIRISLSADAHARHGAIYASSGSTMPTLAITLLGFLSGLLALGALSRLFVETYTGHATTWEDSLAFASSRFVRLVGLGVVMVVALLVGLTFIVPFVFLAVMWSAAVPVLMFEAVGPLDALRRSWELVKGNWWTIFAALVIVLVMVVGVSYFLGVILVGASSSSSVDVILTLQALSLAVGAILTYPLLAAASVVIYVDLRAHKEGVGPESLVPGSTPTR